jgi:O-antigen/teichoic acid export membrane protein
VTTTTVREVSTREMSRGYLRRHAAPLLSVGGLSILGIAATSAFQIVSGRGLGPGAFGLLSAFLAIVNIAAIGASALQNSVAVVTASPEEELPPADRRRLDGPLVEALVLGGVATLAILVTAPTLASALGTTNHTVVLAALTVLPCFLFSVAQGRLQGAGRAMAVTGYLTGQQFLKLLLGGAALIVGLGAVSVLFSVLVATVLVAAAASLQAHRLNLWSSVTAFSRRSVVLISLTLAFAWLTNIDVVLVRAHTGEIVSGAFAAAAVLAKTGMLIPTVLSLYLLPRFASRGQDRDAVGYGVNVVLVTVLVSGIALALGLGILGDLLVRLLFGGGYEHAAELLPWTALAYLPWALAQGLLISLTARASRGALAVLLAAGVVQWISATVFLPDVRAMIAAIGVTGLVTAASLFALHLRRGNAPVSG